MASLIRFNTNVEEEVRLPAGGSAIWTDEDGTEVFRITAAGTVLIQKVAIAPAAPAAHAASHAGSDAVALAQSQITGLEAALGPPLALDSANDVWLYVSDGPPASTRRGRAWYIADTTVYTTASTTVPLWVVQTGTLAGTGFYDPSSVGFAATAGDCFLSYQPSAYGLYLKTGPTDTEWEVQTGGVIPSSSATAPTGAADAL